MKNTLVVMAASMVLSGCVTLAQAQSSHGSSGTVGFSIEAEMLTYRALERDSAVAACDIGSYLYGAASDQAQKGASPCRLRTAPRTPTGVVVIAPGSTLLADFQLWRADMATMKALEDRARDYCGIGRGSGGSKAFGLDLTPEGQALGLLQTSLGLFATNRSVSPVGGTVKDPALISALARQLRVLNISVLVPDFYQPYALGAADDSRSPYFTSLGALMDARTACERVNNPNNPNDDHIKTLLPQMDSFIATVTGTPKSDRPAGAAARLAPVSAHTSEADAAAHFAVIFRADGLARAMGFAPGSDDPSPAWHVLWVQALESGGTVSQRRNIFGSSVRYSGGAVVSYALFSLDGNLRCSGNVYSMAGPLQAKDVRKIFNEPGSASSPLPVVSRTTCGKRQ